MNSDINFETYFHLDLDDFFEHYGLDDGKQLMSLVIEILGEHKDLTFKQLNEKTNKRLVISSVCMNTYDIEYFDHESQPNLKITEAIRASISIPFLFTAVPINNNLYIDGAILEPLPISIFDKEKTLGVWITDKKNNSGYHGDLSCIEGFIYNFMICVKRRIDTLHKFEDQYNILKIMLEDVNILDFEMSLEKKREILDIGYQTMSNYIKNLK